MDRLERLSVLSFVNDDQFCELTDVLRGVTSRLDAIETAVIENRCGCGREDMAEALVNISAEVQRMSDAYSLKDVVRGLWSVEMALQRHR